MLPRRETSTLPVRSGRGWCRCTTHSIGLDSSSRAAILPEGYASFLRAESTRKSVAVFVAELDGRIVGYTYAAIEPLSWQELRDEAGVIHDIFVDETARGRGLATRLIEAVTAWLRQQGMRQVVLHTAFRNTGAQRLFGRLGFRPTMIEMTRDLE